MMKNILLSICAVCFFIAIVCRYNSDFLSGETEKFHIQPSARLQQIPAGELIAGTSLEQKIQLPVSLFNELNQNPTDPVCIALLMATYNRSNTSRYYLYLKQHSKQVVRVIGTEDLHDNAFNKIRFTPAEFSIFTPGPAILGIKSINGSIGNAITLWLTRDTIKGKVGFTSNKINSKPNQNSKKLQAIRSRSMNFSLSILTTYPSTLFIRYFFVLLYAGFIFILVLVWLKYARNHH